VRLDFHRDHRLLFGLVFGGFVALSGVIAVGPALWVNAHNAPLPGSAPLTAVEMEGLRVYVAEGCLFCHSQQVRPLPQDRPFGRPSVPGDYARLAWLDVWREPPGLLGRRDLALDPGLERAAGAAAAVGPGERALGPVPRLIEQPVKHIEIRLLLAHGRRGRGIVLTKRHISWYTFLALVLAH